MITITLMWTPQQVSEMIKVPVSTLRRYAADYSQYLSSSAHLAGKARRYTDRDIVIFEKIRQLLQKGNSVEQVRSLIPLTEFDQPVSTSLAAVPGIAAEIQALNDRAAEIKAVLLANDQRLSAAEMAIADLTDRLAKVEVAKRKSWLRKLVDKLDQVVD